jgi:hypothetical protein
MTIIADRQLYAAPPQGPVRSHAGGKSFAARIEAGERAKNIVQHRALGFSEAGLLGLHYAQDSLNNVAEQPGRNGETDIAPEAMVPTSAKLIDKAIVKADNKTGSINQFPNSDKASGHTNSAGANRALQNLASSSLPSLEVKAIETGETANELQSPLSKVFQKEISQSRPVSKFGLKIIETPNGISVIFEETAVSETEIQELTDVAQQISKDFGVTIRRLVVNGKNSV